MRPWSLPPPPRPGLCPRPANPVCSHCLSPPGGPAPWMATRGFCNSQVQLGGPSGRPPPLNSERSDPTAGCPRPAGTCLSPPQTGGRRRGGLCLAGSSRGTRSPSVGPRLLPLCLPRGGTCCVDLGQGADKRWLRLSKRVAWRCPLPGNPRGKPPHSSVWSPGGSPPAWRGPCSQGLGGPAASAGVS